MLNAGALRRSAPVDGARHYKHWAHLERQGNAAATPAVRWAILNLGNNNYPERASADVRFIRRCSPRGAAAPLTFPDRPMCKGRAVYL